MRSEIDARLVNRVQVIGHFPTELSACAGSGRGTQRLARPGDLAVTFGQCGLSSYKSVLVRGDGCD